MTDDWRGGFLWVGNHLSLDFLNTKPLAAGAPVELLPDAGAFARWLAHAGLISERRWRSLEPVWRELPEISHVIVFREWLREAVVAVEEGRRVPTGFVKELNRRLADHPIANEVVETETGLILRRKFDPKSPLESLGLLARVSAELITSSDTSRLRKCAACPLHFLDTSRKGTRRWCSMNLCGNRSKVAAYSARKQSGVRTTTSPEE